MDPVDFENKLNQMPIRFSLSGAI